MHLAYTSSIVVYIYIHEVAPFCSQEEMSLHESCNACNKHFLFVVSPMLFSTRQYRYDVICTTGTAVMEMPSLVHMSTREHLDCLIICWYQWGPLKQVSQTPGFSPAFTHDIVTLVFAALSL